MSGDLDVSDGHCHELVDGGVVVVGVVAAVVGVVIFLGFTTTLFGQDKFGGLLALYFGVVFGAVVGGVALADDVRFDWRDCGPVRALEDVPGAVGVLGLLSNVAVGPGPSYGSSEAGVLLNNLIIS